MATYRVSLESFQGPIDLLLHLVKKHELTVTQVALTRIVDDYFAALETLSELDLDQVGDFIEVASMLVEYKLRAILPSDEPESDLAFSDPREELVPRLLLYKQFKDVSLLLEDHSRDWQQCYPRIADDVPARPVDLRDQPIHEVELWDLVSAFGRLLRDQVPPPDENIYYDETPIHVHLQRLHSQILEHGQVAFSELFEVGMHKSSMIGVFLGILELVRHHGAVTEQPDPDGEIWIRPGSQFQRDLDLANVDTYSHRDLQPGDPASFVR